MKRFMGILIGIIVIGVGIFTFISGKNLEKRCTATAVGTVVEMHEDISSDTHSVTHTYYPVIEYQVGDRTVKKQSSSGSSSPRYNINEKVDILYNPDNVEEYIIKGDTNSNFMGIIFIVVGVVVVILGIWNLIRGR